MPNEIISIKRFGGAVTTPQQEDIPNELAVFCKDLDPQTERGTIRGMPEEGAAYSANGTAIPDV